MNWIFAKCIFFKLQSSVICCVRREKPQMKTEEKKPSGKKTSQADERQTDDRMLGKIHCFFFRSPSGLSPSSSPKERARRDEMMISSTSSFLHTHHTYGACLLYICRVVPWSLRRRLFARLLSSQIVCIVVRTGRSWSHGPSGAICRLCLFSVCVCVSLFFLLLLPLSVDAPSRLCSPLQTLCSVATPLHYTAVPLYTHDKTFAAFNFLRTKKESKRVLGAERVRSFYFIFSLDSLRRKRIWRPFSHSSGNIALLR